MFRSLPTDGVAVINADDKYAPMWLDTRVAECVYTFGFEQQADFMAHKVRQIDVNQSGGTGEFRIDFDLVTPVDTKPATIGLAGLHNLRNSLGAAAASFAAGASIDDIVAGLAALKKVSGRLEFKPAIRSAFLVDDSYNANPSSLKAGLDAFRTFTGERWLVLGEMRELGDSSDELHAEVGRYAKQSGVSRVFAIGAGSRFAVQAFGANAQWFADMDALIAAVSAELKPGVAVLIKGSRSNRLERVSAALVDPAAASSIASDGH
jgi:UDP-N-acetylmuramoyl-tripeptide--D-alanyl-D-alanine ligase